MAEDDIDEMEEPTEYQYVVDLDERGEFKAHVEDFRGATVWEGDIPEMVEDGFMKHNKDVGGLEEYLKEHGILPGDASIAEAF